MLDAPLLQGHFARVLERKPDLTHRFYEILFTRYPQLVPLFAVGERSRQELMLTKALVWLVEHLEDGEILASALPVHGAKHESYGVTDEMYPWVGEALLAAIAEAAADDWTPEIERAWSQAYLAVTELMLSGTSR